MEKATYTGHVAPKDEGRRSIAGMAQHSIPGSMKESLFLKKFLFDLTFLKFRQKNETAVIFTKEISLKMNRTKKKVR